MSESTVVLSDIIYYYGATILLPRVHKPREAGVLGAYELLDPDNKLGSFLIIIRSHVITSPCMAICYPI